MAVTSNNALKIKLLMYFVLGIILYVYGQKVMRGKLIELTNEIVYSKRMGIVKNYWNLLIASLKKLKREEFSPFILTNKKFLSVSPK